jgi:hypothetical protein
MRPGQAIARRGGAPDILSRSAQLLRLLDFSTWEVLGVHGDGDTVFATTRVAIANTSKTMYIAEQFTFSGTKLVDVRVHVCDAPDRDPGTP